MRESNKYWDNEAGAGALRAVTDPKDRRGSKIKYITSLRDGVILRELNDFPFSAKILDLGCGSGSLAPSLRQSGYMSVGVDISWNLLRFAKNVNLDVRDSFVMYDGNSLPFSSCSFDACVTYEVLQHLTGSNQLAGVLGEINRILKPGGRLIAIEQTRRKNRLHKKEVKLQRKIEDFLQLLIDSQFKNEKNYIVRRGHFPLIYMVRYGLVPERFFPFLQKIELFLGQIFRRPLFDYANSVFIVKKPK